MSDDGRIPLSECLADLNRFLVGVKDIWAQGPTFDITILENLYKQMLVPRPWNFWQIRDSRTLFGVHGDPRDKNRASAHNALEDAYSQAQAMQTIYKQVGIKPH
jgi:exodeoxyribonuclease VIII